MLEVFFFDELIIGFDIWSCCVLWDIICMFVDMGMIVFFMIQYLEEVDQFVDCIVVLYDGRIVVMGMLVELKVCVGGDIVEFLDDYGEIWWKIFIDGSVIGFCWVFDLFDEDGEDGIVVLCCLILDDVFFVVIVFIVLNCIEKEFV